MNELGLPGGLKRLVVILPHSSFFWVLYFFVVVIVFFFSFFGLWGGMPSAVLASRLSTRQTKSPKPRGGMNAWEPGGWLGRGGPACGVSLCVAQEAFFFTSLCARVLHPLLLFGFGLQSTYLIHLRACDSKE